MYHLSASWTFKCKKKTNGTRKKLILRDIKSTRGVTAFGTCMDLCPRHSTAESQLYLLKRRWTGLFRGTMTKKRRKNKKKSRSLKKSMVLNWSKSLRWSLHLTQEGWLIGLLLHGTIGSLPKKHQQVLKPHQVERYQSSSDTSILSRQLCKPIWIKFQTNKARIFSCVWWQSWTCLVQRLCLEMVLYTCSELQVLMVDNSLSPLILSMATAPFTLESQGPSFTTPTGQLKLVKLEKPVLSSLSSLWVWQRKISMLCSIKSSMLSELSFSENWKSEAVLEKPTNSTPGS